MACRRARGRVRAQHSRTHNTTATMQRRSPSTASVNFKKSVVHALLRVRTLAALGVIRREELFFAFSRPRSTNRRSPSSALARGTSTSCRSSVEEIAAVALPASAEVRVAAELSRGSHTHALPVSGWTGSSCAMAFSHPGRAPVSRNKAGLARVPRTCSHPTLRTVVGSCQSLNSALPAVYCAGGLPLSMRT